jgi:hypothetical protein
MNPIRSFLVKRRMKKSGLRFTRSDVLKSRPVRNSLIKWEKSENGEISLIVPQKNTLWVRIVSKIFMLPGSRVVALDEVGSFVWSMCDGHNSIDGIVKTLRNKYKLTRKEAETSLLAYFRKLGKRGMLGFAVSKKVKHEMESDTSILPSEIRAKSGT